MPAKKVLQYNCGRCQRVWYVDESKEKSEPKQELTLTADITVTNEDGSLTPKKYEVSYECLCPGCAKTVAALLDSIKRDFAKASPVRKAKKKDEAGKGEGPSPTDPASTTPTVARVGDAVTVVLPSPPNGTVSGAPAAGKVSPSVQPRPIR